MPIVHRVDPETGILFVRRWGSITSQDEDEALQRRHDDPLVVAGIPTLVDCRDVEAIDTIEVVKHLANRAAKITAELSCGPLAIVVSSDAEYGMARIYEALTDLVHPRTKVFRNYDKALRWLRPPKSSQK